ncbi:MAG: (d)CMP kinase [Clostridia bacterium]|nr:(d)CMP kinase [Clostridia bacterium]
MNIAIDGPSGAGKSSLAKAIAKKLGIIYVDTGALYRTIGLYMKAHGVDPHDAAAVTAALPGVELSLAFENGAQHIYLCGEDVGERIRTPEMSLYASAVSAIGTVRSFLLDTQRKVARSTSVVMDGRDIGTVILPDAECKIFLTASPEARARRRTDELLAKGMDVKYETVLEEMILRDRNDSTREIAPAVPAKDAIFLDNSDMTAEDTLVAALKIIENSRK